MLGSTLIWDEVVQMGEPRQKRLLTSPGMMEPFHGEQFSLDSIMRLIQERARHRHLGVFKDGIPARLLLLEPAPNALAVGFPGALCHAVGKVAARVRPRNSQH